MKIYLFVYPWLGVIHNIIRFNQNIKTLHSNILYNFLKSNNIISNSSPPERFINKNLKSVIFKHVTIF